MVKKKSIESKIEVATFGMGCFWKPQVLFDNVAGVIETEVGFMGGDESDEIVSYKQVCTNTTGHAEVVEIKFDPQKISYTELLKIFWSNHNPTTMNRQGLDFGSQYRSVIFYCNEKQKKDAEKSKTEAQKNWEKKIVTQIAKAGKFYLAEEYHQKYYKKHGRVC